MTSFICSMVLTIEEKTRQGYADYPDYLQHIWPLIVRRKENIRKMYIVQHDEMRLPKASVNGLFQVAHDIFDLGDVKLLSISTWEKIKYFSYYQGDRNIMYVINSIKYLKEFVSNWPYKTKPQTGIDCIGYSESDKERIYDFTKTICNQNDAIVIFNHDADPVYIIGSNLLLNKIS